MTVRWLVFQVVVLVVLSAWAYDADGAAVNEFETFDTQAVGDSWTSYHYDDGAYYFPTWVAGGNPYIGTSFGYNGSFLYADATASNGMFTGNYLSAGVMSVGFELHCDNPALIDTISLAVATLTTSTSM